MKKPVEPSGAPGHKTTHTKIIETPGPYWLQPRNNHKHYFVAKTLGQNRRGEADKRSAL